MRHPPAGRYRPAQKHPPLPENPYRRFFTPGKSFTQLVRTAREAEKANISGTPAPTKKGRE